MYELLKLSSKQLPKLRKWIARKERVLERKLAADTRYDQEIDYINARIESLVNQKKRGRPRVVQPPGRVVRNPKNGRKEGILAALKGADAKGMTVKELASSLNTNPNNLYTWFHTTGKKVSGLKKSEDGRYRYEEK